MERAEQHIEGLAAEKRALERQAHNLVQALKEAKANYDAELEAHAKTRALCAQRLQWLEEAGRPAAPSQARQTLGGLAAEFRARGGKKR